MYPSDWIAESQRIGRGWRRGSEKGDEGWVRARAAALRVRVERAKVVRKGLLEWRVGRGRRRAIVGGGGWEGKADWGGGVGMRWVGGS